MQNAQCQNGQCSVSSTGNVSCSPSQCCTTSSRCKDQGSCCTADDMLCDLMCTTKYAKKCLMKDKIKDRLEAKIGKKMDQAADLAVDLFLKKWESMQDCKNTKAEAAQKLENIIKG